MAAAFVPKHRKRPSPEMDTLSGFSTGSDNPPGQTTVVPGEGRYDTSVYIRGRSQRASANIVRTTASHSQQYRTQHKQDWTSQSQTLHMIRTSELTSQEFRSWLPPMIQQARATYWLPVSSHRYHRTYPGAETST